MLDTTLNNRYTLEAELGRGGMGVVYRARDLQLDRMVAVKVLPPEFTQNTQFLARFNREILNTAKLTHPHIVSIFDVGVDGPIKYYVMQYIDGQDLESLLAQHGRLSVQETCRILEQIAAALDYAHEQGVVHRDIKPENILIDLQGVPRVVDFGIAKSAEGTRMTGGMIGTPEYMSPEQGRGEASDGRSDQYSLAIVTYEMLTGTTPFRSASSQPWAIINMHLTVPPPDPRQYAGELPENVCAVLLQALDKVAERRFATCSDMAKALSGQTPIINREVSINPKRGMNKPMLFVAFSLVAIVLMTGIILVSRSALSNERIPRNTVETVNKPVQVDNPVATPAFVSKEVLPPSIHSESAPVLQQADRSDIESLVERWRVAREAEDMPAYLDCYTFPVWHKGNDKSINELSAFERQMFDKHEDIQIKIADISISNINAETMVSFNQSYDANDSVSGQQIHSQGEKRLRVRQMPAGWKIYREDESK